MSTINTKSFEVNYHGGIKNEIYQQIIHNTFTTRGELKLRDLKDYMFYRQNKLTLKKSIVVRIIDEDLYIFAIEKYVTPFYKIPQKYAECLKKRIAQYDPKQCEFDVNNIYIEGNAKELKEVYMSLPDFKNDIIMKLNENTYLISPYNQFDTIQDVIDFSYY